MNTLLLWLLRLFYGFRAYNLASLNTPGPVLLLPNHVSWWDWLLIAACLDKDWRFVTSIESSEISWIHKKFMVNRRTFPVDMNSPYAVKRMAEYLQTGGRLVLFPEGRLSRSGSLMKLFDGTGFLIYKTGAKVITAFIRGAARLPLSPNPNRKKWFPRISVHFSDVLTPARPDNVSATQGRARLTEWLRDRLVEQQFRTEMEFGPRTLPKALDSIARSAPGRAILQDATLQQLSYRKLMTASSLLGALWRKRWGDQSGRVGMLLPNVIAMPVTLLSLWEANKTPAVLNYSTGATNILTCARVAGLKQIITSKTFVERAKMDLAPFQQAGIEIVFLEETRTEISGFDKLFVSLQHLLGLNRVRSTMQANDIAVILFTSGSEGEPKGVELTHANLLSNIRQMLSVIDLIETDRFFNALPLFHSFGLTVGLLLPLIRGVFVFLYLSPLHYRVVPSAFYNLDCTVFFGTNTFLNGYSRKAHPYDFRKLRYAFAAGEKLHESTATVWSQKFGVRLLEGYGATECSPCITVNVPIRVRHGSAGQFLPGIEYKLESVEGVPETQSSAKNGENEKVGRLLVRGPNVMRGYANEQANARFQSLGGWYDTGDIVRVDADGFVFILGRLKRFAKVSGEMISLTAVEDALAGAFPQYGLRFAAAVLARADETKGEKLIAATNEPRLTLEEVRAALRARGLSNLAMPREIKVIRDLPKLGTGKINHRELEKLI